MMRVFNSVFEVSLRVLLILNINVKELSVDRIVAIDFISMYGKDFMVSKSNLQGDNTFRFAEFASRREMVLKAIKDLLLKKYIEIYCTENGFLYGISSDGKEFCGSLNDEYAEIFNQTVKTTCQKFINYSDFEMNKTINEYAIGQLEGDKI